MAEWYGGNVHLTQEEMEVNARYIYNYLYPKGWTLNAIAAMLGNMQSESGINPQIWESLVIDSEHGYGLVQWTPSTKLSEWAQSENLDYTQMDTQLQRIIYESEHGLQWGTTTEYPIGFTDFIKSTANISYLANAFLYNYERPENLNQPNRATQAAAWYNFLSGATPPIGGTINLNKGNFNLLYYIKRRK